MGRVEPRENFSARNILLVVVIVGHRGEKSFDFVTVENDSFLSSRS